MKEPAGAGAAEKTITPVHYGYVILLIGFLTVTGALGFARFGYTTILPSMKAGLGLGNAEMGMLATGNLAGYMLFSLVSGFLASKYGPRVVIVFSMLLAGVTMFLTGLAGGIWTALVFRAMTGFGSAGSNIPMMGLVSAWFAPRCRGMAAGILVGGSGVALLVTGFLVPKVVAAWPENGWRLSWFILGGIVVCLGVVSYLFLRNHPGEKGLTPIGSLPSGEAMAKVPAPPLCLAENEPPAGGKAAGVEVSWASVYGSRALWQIGAIYFTFGFSYIIFATFFSAALVSDKGLTQAEAGSMWAAVGAISIFSGFLWGGLSDRIGRKTALAAIFALQSVCYSVFALSTSPVALYLVVLLFGLTSWSIPGVVAATCGDYLGARLAPAALGMVTLFFGVGQALAPSVAGFSADLAGSFTPALLIASAVAALGALGSLTLRPPKAVNSE